MSLDLTADADALLTDFSEPLEFRSSSGASAVSFSGNVNREPLEEDTDGPFAGNRRAVIHVMAKNIDGTGDTDGISPSDVTNDTSEIKVAYPKGATAQWYPINRILKQNAGFALYEVQV